MGNQEDLEKLLNSAVKGYREVVGDLLFAYEERILNCQSTDVNERDCILYNEQDLTIDLYTIVEEYTDKFIDALELIIEDRLDKISDRQGDPLNQYEK